MSLYDVLYKLSNKNVFSNDRLKFAGFFDHQYLWKGTDGVLDFLHRDSYKRKKASKSFTIGWVWPGLSSHAQTCLNLSGSRFV